jgi:hypothetical protein
MKRVCLTFLFSLTLPVQACESEHHIHDAALDEPADTASEDADAAGDPDGADDPEGTGEDAGEDASPDMVEPAEASCGEGGVIVEGTVFFEGEVPAQSRLWIYWQLPSPSFPPLPVEGDCTAAVEASELDLTGDVSGLELHLEPHAP